MSAIQKFREVTKVLNELSTAAVSARSEVQKLLTVLEGPATDVKQKIAPAGDWVAGSPKLPTGDLSGNYADTIVLVGVEDQRSSTA